MDTAGNAFSVAFANERVLAPGSGESYLLVVDIAQSSATASGDWTLMLATGGAGLPLLAVGLLGLPRRRGAMAALLGWVADGRLKVAAVSEFPLSRAGDAHRALESAQTVGKLVLDTEK